MLLFVLYFPIRFQLARMLQWIIFPTNWPYYNFCKKK